MLRGWPRRTGFKPAQSEAPATGRNATVCCGLTLVLSCLWLEIGSLADSRAKFLAAATRRSEPSFDVSS
jgi:hypothetical protein